MSEFDKRLDVLKDEDGNLLMTASQQQAVLDSGHILVSASAGSGKTSTMVKRIILMVSEGASLRNMLILVYNNAAADELKERLHHELFKQACASTNEKRDHFAKELDDLSFCHISTIHAFCQNLIRENFDKLGISPTFEVLDEGAHKVYMNRALDEIIADYSNAQDDEFLDIVEFFSQARKNDNLKNQIIRMFNLIDIQPDESEFKRCMDECYSSFDESKFIDILMQYYKSLASRAREIFISLEEQSRDCQNMVGHRQNLISAIVVCDEMLASKDFYSLCIAPNRYEGARFSVSSKRDVEEALLAEKIKNYVKPFIDSLDELAYPANNFDRYKEHHKQNAKYVYKLYELATAFSNKLKGLKNADNVLSFEDLQHKAMELLLQDGVDEKFDAVFVDEYQDVNPLQEAIIQKLIKDESFIVGDVKQSIYGFRLSDPMILLSRQDRYKKYEGEGKNIFFNQNFRSEKAILQFVNDVFDSAMTRESADIDYKSEARFEFNKDEAKGDYVHLHLFHKPTLQKKEIQGLYDITSHVDDDSEEDNCAREGAFIADKVKELVGKLKTTDDISGGKHLNYSDIAILFRARTSGAQQILDVLRDNGIPLNDSAFSKTESLPERELISMLKVIDNPRQDIALAGFLLSFIGGYSEEELASISSCKGDAFYDRMIARIKEGDVLSNKIKDTLKVLDTYRLKASFENVAALMSDIVRDYCYDAYVTLNGESDVYALKAFINSARTLDMSLGEFLQNYNEGESASVGAGGGDRVVVSTFHGYKGLESPVVFVADIASNFNTKGSSGDLIASGKGIGIDQSNKNYKGLIGMSAFDFDKRVKYSETLSKLAVKKCIIENQVKEEIRLFYVALTRAKQLMYITATLPKKKADTFGKLPGLMGAKSALELISNAKYDGTCNINAIIHDENDEGLKDVKSVTFSALENDEYKAQIAKAISYEYPYKDATELSRKYSVSEIGSIDETTIRVYDDGANIGTAYHKVMQNIDYFIDSIDGVKAEINRMLVEGILTVKEVECVKAEEIFECLNSEVMSLAKKAQLESKCYREQPFMMYVPASEASERFTSSEKVLVQGVIDLFIDGDEKIILDFKNSRLKDVETLKKYKKQLYLYKKAVESAFCVNIDKVMLYSFKTGKTIEM